MIELVFIALAATVVAVVVVWLYRRLTESRGMNTTLVSLSNNNGTLRLSQQQGFVTLQASKKAGRKKPKAQPPRTVQSKNGSGVRKPWGW